MINTLKAPLLIQTTWWTEIKLWNGKTVGDLSNIFFYDGTKNIKIPSRWNPNEIPLADIDTSLIGLFITLGPFFSSAATAYVSITEKPNFVSRRKLQILKSDQGGAF